jgi:hypothetical protein
VRLNPVVRSEPVEPLPSEGGGSLLDEIARQMGKIREYHRVSSDSESAESSGTDSW